MSQREGYFVLVSTDWGVNFFAPAKLAGRRYMRPSTALNKAVGALQADNVLKEQTTHLVVMHEDFRGRAISHQSYRVNAHLRRKFVDKKHKLDYGEIAGNIEI